MKKKFKVLAVIAAILFFVGLGMYLILPYIPRWMGETQAAAFYGNTLTYYLMPFKAFALWFNFSNLHYFQIIGLCISGIAAILMIIWFVAIFNKRRYKNLFVWVYVLITWLITGYILLHISFSSVGGRDGLFYELLEVGNLASEGSAFPIIHMVDMIVAYLFGAIGFVSSCIVYVFELKETFKYKPESKKVLAAKDDETIVSDDLDEVVEGGQEEPKDTEPVPSCEQPRVIKGPLLVQYIDTTGTSAYVSQNPYQYPQYQYPQYQYPYYGQQAAAPQAQEVSEPSKEEPVPEEKRDEDPNITAIRSIMNQNLKGDK